MHSVNCGVPAAPSPQSGNDEGNWSWGDKQQGTTQFTELTTLGVIRNLHHSEICPACNQLMRMEACYMCQSCKILHHVRCLGHASSTTDRHFQYSNTCWLCNIAHDMHQSMEPVQPSPSLLPMSPKPPFTALSPPSSSPPALAQEMTSMQHVNLIEDVMGVCSGEELANAPPPAATQSQT